MTWNIPPIDSLDLAERKCPPNVPVDFQLTTKIQDVPPPSAGIAGVAVSMYDYSDRNIIESLDTHAEEVSHIELID